MAAPRKAKADDGGTRRRLLEATAQIMHDEGYAAATSRRVAAKAGIRQPLVHYYFPTMDDLFLAVLREGADVAQLQNYLPGHGTFMRFLSGMVDEIGQLAPYHEPGQCAAVGFGGRGCRDDPTPA